MLLARLIILLEIVAGAGRPAASSTAVLANSCWMPDLAARSLLALPNLTFGVPSCLKAGTGMLHIQKFLPQTYALAFKRLLNADFRIVIRELIQTSQASQPRLYLNIGAAFSVRAVGPIRQRSRAAPFSFVV